jgi:hypothetical protein
MVDKFKPAGQDQWDGPVKPLSTTLHAVLYQKGSTRILKRRLELLKRTKPNACSAVPEGINNVSNLSSCAVQSVQASEKQSQELVQSFATTMATVEKTNQDLTLEMIKAFSDKVHLRRSSIFGNKRILFE